MENLLNKMDTASLTLIISHQCYINSGSNLLLNILSIIKVLLQNNDLYYIKMEHSTPYFYMYQPFLYTNTLT